MLFQKILFLTIFTALHAMLTLWLRSIPLSWMLQPYGSERPPAPLSVKVGEAFFWLMSSPVFGPWQLWGDTLFSSIVGYGESAGKARVTLLVVNSLIWAFSVWHLAHVITQRRRCKLRL